MEELARLAKRDSRASALMTRKLLLGVFNHLSQGKLVVFVQPQTADESESDACLVNCPGSLAIILDPVRGIRSRPLPRQRVRGGVTGEPAVTTGRYAILA